MKLFCEISDLTSSISTKTSGHIFLGTPWNVSRFSLAMHLRSGKYRQTNLVAEISSESVICLVLKIFLCSDFYDLLLVFWKIKKRINCGKYFKYFSTEKSWVPEILLTWIKIDLYNCISQVKLSSLLTILCFKSVFYDMTSEIWVWLPFCCPLVQAQSYFEWNVQMAPFWKVQQPLVNPSNKNCIFFSLKPVCLLMFQICQHEQV